MHVGKLYVQRPLTWHYYQSRCAKYFGPAAEGVMVHLPSSAATVCQKNASYIPSYFVFSLQTFSWMELIIYSVL